MHRFMLSLILLLPLQSGQTQDQLTFKEVIEIVADYELLHPTVPYVTPWYGVTDYDNRTIFVIREL